MHHRLEGTHFPKSGVGGSVGMVLASRHVHLICAVVNAAAAAAAAAAFASNQQARSNGAMEGDPLNEKSKLTNQSVDKVRGLG